MFFDPLEIPDELLEAQEQGKLVVFAGAGVSMGDPSNLPGFKGLARAIAGSHPLAGEIDEYDARLDRFLGELARNKVAVQELCRAEIGNPTSKPTELHRSIVDLFISPEHIRIVTTNFEDHFKSVFAERGLRPDCYHAPALPLGHQFSGLVHLHGWIGRPEPLVLTDEDFGRAYLTEGWAREFLQRLFTEFTTLFVGYSHNDLPVEYLARGLSGKPIGSRFAFTAAGETGQWASLGIKEIVFQKASGPDPYLHLKAGLKKWAEFTKQQPIEIAERVKNILCAPEHVKPDKTQGSLLLRCLGREDSCHFFTEEAKGWRWIEWLDENRLLARFFETSRRELSSHEAGLADWLAKALLAEKSETGLLLVERHRGTVSRPLWSSLCRSLRLDKNRDWGSPLIHKWLLLLIETCPVDALGQLALLFPTVVRAGPKTLGMVLLRRMISLRIAMTKAIDFGALLKRADLFRNDEKIEVELALGFETHYLDSDGSWDHLLKDYFADLAEPLTTLLEDRIREAHQIYRAAGRADSRNDPVIFRGRISERTSYRTRHGLSVVLELLLDVVEEHSNQASGLPIARIESWLKSAVPALVRVGLYALHLNKSIPGPSKIKLLQDLKLVHPPVFGATHEAWQVLTANYSTLSAAERASLWQAVNDGPAPAQPSILSPEDWAEYRQGEIDKLTWFIGTKHPDCTLAQAAIRQLRERNPSFQGYEGIDQIIFDGGKRRQVSESPRSASDLLQQSPGEQIEWLMAYQGSTPPFEPSRAGLLGAVGAACTQNQAWAIALLKELESRKVWASDLWAAAVSRMGMSSLAADDLGWLLRTLELHIVDFPTHRWLASFLFSNIDLSDGKRPSNENIDLLIRVSLLIWKQIRGEQPPRTKDFDHTDWGSDAINHPAGYIVEFWLKVCSYDQTNPNRQSVGFPAWLSEALADLIGGKDYASQLGKAILGMQLRFLYHTDPNWTSTQLFPKLQFSQVGDEAFLLWEPHVRYGNLSRDLILVMRPLYRETFSHIGTSMDSIRDGFFNHVASIVHSCLFDVNEDAWFKSFLTSLNDEQRTVWAEQMEFCLRDTPDAWGMQIWQRWMKGYWEDRIRGRPCPLLPKEAETMVEWAFGVGQAFPEAVDLVVRGPHFEPNIGIVVHILEGHAAPENYPEALLRLLDWLLGNGTGKTMIADDIEKVLFRLPKKKTFRAPLISICQHLARLAYRGVADLKSRIDQIFIED